MIRTAPLGRSLNFWRSAVYLLLGVGPWLFLVGYTAWEVIVPACTSGRELWPPPSGAFLLMVVLGGPWLLAMIILTLGLKLLRQPVRTLVLTTSAFAFGSWLILLVFGPFAQSHSWRAMRAECERIRSL